jgi:lipopolysaccharide biosynthesis protein
MKTLISFVHFDRGANSASRLNLDFFIKFGLIDSPDYQFNFVINSETGGDHIPNKPNVSVIKGHNKGYDNGGWKQSFDFSGIDNFDYFICINDTCRGPFLPNYIPKSLTWVEMFLKDIDEKVKLVGPTWFNKKFHHLLQNDFGIPEGKNNHIQSYCFGMDRETLKFCIKNEKFNAIGKSKTGVIKDHEIGMSTLLLNNGFQIKPFLLSRNSGQKHSCVSQHKGAYFGDTINPLEVMFFKTTIQNQTIENYTKWKMN